MGELMIESMLRDLRAEIKAMSRQIDNMNSDIQEIKRQLAEQDKHNFTCKCNESAVTGDNTGQ